MKNVSMKMKIGFAAVFAIAVLAGCSGKKTASGGHEKVTIFRRHPRRARSMR